MLLCECEYLSAAGGNIALTSLESGKFMCQGYRGDSWRGSECQCPEVIFGRVGHAKESGGIQAGVVEELAMRGDVIRGEELGRQVRYEIVHELDNLAAAIAVLDGHLTQLQWQLAGSQKDQFVAYGQSANHMGASVAW